MGRGAGLAGTPAPFVSFRDVYAAASEGLHRVAHAREEGGPGYVRVALEQLYVERIDHGNRAMEDLALVARLRAEAVPLMVCPLSNLAPKMVDRLEQHPLPQMVAAGLRVMGNGDDRVYFCGYIEDNYQAVRKELGLSEENLFTVAANSFDACFADERQRSVLKDELQSAAAASTP